MDDKTQYQEITLILLDGRRISAVVRPFWDGEGDPPGITGFEISPPEKLEPRCSWRKMGAAEKGED